MIALNTNNTKTHSLEPLYEVVLDAFDHICSVSASMS